MLQPNSTLKILTVNGQRYRADTGELVTLEELQSEGWKLATPRIAKSLIERGIVRVTKAKPKKPKETDRERENRIENWKRQQYGWVVYVTGDPKGYITQVNETFGIVQDTTQDKNSANKYRLEDAYELLNNLKKYKRQGHIEYAGPRHPDEKSIKEVITKAGLPPSGGVTGSAPTSSNESIQEDIKPSNLFLSEKVARAPVDRLKGVTKLNGQGTKSWTPGSVMDWVERLSVENHGLVPLWKLGQKIGCSPQALHSAIQELRRRGRLTASSFEGRQGINETERRWLLNDGHEQIGYVSIKSDSRGVTKGKGEPCKRGETAAKDECTPKSREGVGRDGGVKKPIPKLKKPSILGPLRVKAALWAARLSKKEKASLEDYVDNSELVNKAVRDQPILDLIPGEVGEKARAIAAALEKAPELNGLEVYRGQQWYKDEPEFLSLATRAAKEGGALRFAGFQSSTIDPEIAENFSSGTVLEITTARRGAYLERNVARKNEQHEILLPHNSMFRVDEVTEREYPIAGDGTKMLKVVRMTQLSRQDEKAYQDTPTNLSSVMYGKKVSDNVPVNRLKSIKSESIEVVKGKGEPCQQGETAAKDDCIPATRRGESGTKTGERESGSGELPDSPRNPPSVRQDSSGSKMRGVGRFVVRTFQNAIQTYQNLKTTSVRFRDVGYDKLPPKAQRKLSKIWAAVKYIEHKIMTGFTKGRQLAEEAARERGLPKEHVEKLGKVLATIDTISAWTVNMPATLAVTGSMTTAKMASWIPVASLSYVAYSTAKNPFATIRAAKAVIKKSRKTKGKGYMVTKEFLDNKQLSEALADGMKEAGDNVEWYLALISSALDETPDDPLEAIKVASEAFKREPAPQDEDYGLSEEDIEGIDLGEGDDDIERPVNRLSK